MPAISFAAAAAASADKPDPSVAAREEAMKLLVQQGQDAGPSSASASASRQDASANGVDSVDDNQKSTLPEASASQASSASSEYLIKYLILDASPLLTQAPIQALHAQNIYIPPQVVAELKDPKARQHLEWLKMQGQKISVMEGGPEALLKGVSFDSRTFETWIACSHCPSVAVIAFAKLTGDYAVLSTADLAVLALSYALEAQEHGTWRIRDQVGGKTGQQKHEAEKVQKMRKDGTLPVKGNGKVESANGAGSDIKGGEESPESAQAEESEVKADSKGTAEELAKEAPSSIPSANAEEQALVDVTATSAASTTDAPTADAEDSDEGEWITSDNLQEHKNLALGIVTQESKHDKDAAVAVAQTFDSSSTAEAKAPATNGKGKGKARTQKAMSVACITSDYAVQNVMLQMGLSLISMSGQRITQVKSWVLRCHACMK
jgi:RNA-binding protein NOB1